MIRRNAHIIVTTLIMENDEICDEQDVRVELEGDFEFYGSANPHERGYRLSIWRVTSPNGFELDNDEKERAEQALYDNL